MKKAARFQNQSLVTTKADALRCQIAMRGYVVCGNEVGVLFWRRWEVQAFSDGHALWEDHARPGSREFKASHRRLTAALSQLLLKVEAAEEEGKRTR